MTMVAKFTPLLHHLGLRDLGESDVEKELLSTAIQCSGYIQAMPLLSVDRVRFWILSNGVVVYAAKSPRSSEYDAHGVLDNGANFTRRVNPFDTAYIAFTATNVYLLCAEIVRLAETMSGHEEADPIIRSLRELNNRLEQMRRLSTQ